MDMVAVELGLDPVRVRLKNYPKPTEFPFHTPTGLTYDSGNYQGALKKAQKLANWDKLLKQRHAQSRQTLRSRTFYLCRDLRAGAIEDDGRGWLGMGLRAPGNVGQGHR